MTDRELLIKARDALEMVEFVNFGSWSARCQKPDEFMKLRNETLAEITAHIKGE